MLQNGMTVDHFPKRPLSEGFGLVGSSIHDPLAATCRRIGALRHKIIDYATAHNLFTHNGNGMVIGLKPGTCTAEIAEMAALLDTIPYSPALQTQATLQAGLAARSFRQSSSFQSMRAQWGALSEDARMACLKTMSQAMTRSINENHPLIINDPLLTKARLTGGAAMQVNNYRHPTQDINLLMISINHATLDSPDFDKTAAMLWHEHLHVYMTHLRDAFDQGEITPDHALYHDARKASLISACNIPGNNTFSETLYRSEPEEKLCYQSQDVFYRVLRYKPSAPGMTSHHE